MAETYGTTSIPSDSITVRSGGTTAISAAFESTVGLVGGMDTNNGNATPGDVVEIESTSDADDQFGDDSELARQCALAFNNDVSTIYAVGVTETTVTSEQVTQSDTLDNTSVFDPNVNTEHDITAADTGGTDPTVSIVYDSPPQTPSGPDEANVNPVTGEIEFDATASTQYEVDYDYGAYSSAITSLVKKVPRFIVALTENTSVANTLLSEVNSYDTDFDFMHAIAGATPEVSPGSYSDSFDDRRMIVVAPSRAFTDSANNTMVRTMGAVGGLQAGSALGNSTTFEGLGGFADLNTQYTNSELSTLIDAEVYTIKQGGGIKVVKDMTTSQDAKFERVYASEIVDEVTEISHQISQQFIGNLNTADNRTALEEGHNSAYGEMVDDNQLDDYAVNATLGANDDEVDVSIGVDVVDVMDLIDVSITVGDVITNGGAS